MRVLGKKINCLHKNIDINKVSYYPKNPRLQKDLDQSALDQESVHRGLARKPSTDKLAPRIFAHGGLLEDIWVLDNKTNKIKDTDDLPYVVLEGNTRVNIFKRLMSPEEDKWSAKYKINKEDFKTINCKVITDKLSQEEIYAILEELHDRDKGKNDWDLAALASYYREKHEQGFLTKELEEESTKKAISKGQEKGDSSKRINQYIETDKLIEENDEAGSNKFTHYLEIQKSIPLRKIFKSKNQDDLKIKNKIMEGLKTSDKKLAIKAADVRDILGKVASHRGLIKKWATAADMTVRELEDLYSIKTDDSQIVRTISTHIGHVTDEKTLTHLKKLKLPALQNVIFNINKLLKQYKVILKALELEKENKSN